MKVLFLISFKGGFTGPALGIINVIHGLLKRGIEVYIVASEPAKDQLNHLERLKEKNAKIVTIPSNLSKRKFWKAFAKKGLEVFDKNDIDILHAHSIKTVHYMGKEVKKRDKKMVMMLSGNPVFEMKEYSILIKLYIKMVWRSCKKYVDIFCPASNHLSNAIIKQDGIDNVIPIHVAVDVEKFLKAKENPRFDLNISNSTFVIGTVARLAQVKNLDVLIKAFAIFTRDHENSMLAIFGVGELKSKLEELVKSLQIQDKVKFYGYHNNIPDVIKIFDVFVLPSHGETFGTSSAEAGVCKIPVIVSDSGGMKEYVTDAKTGLIFKVGDHLDLNRCLEELYANPDLRKDLGENLSKYVIENYSPDIISGKVIDVYNKVLNK